MNANIKKTLVSGLVALIVAGTLASAPAQARGGSLRFFGSLADFASSIADRDDQGAYNNTPLQPYNKPCHNETRKLYDDNDNVVAHQVVQVCPAK